MSMDDLLSVQAGKEVSLFTAVTPTVKLMLMNKFDIKPVVQSKVVMDKRASQGPSDVAVIELVDANFSFEQGASYEDLEYWLESLMGIATPSGSNPYVYACAAPETNAGVSNPRSQTFVKGDGTNCYKLVGGVLSDLTITGVANKMVMLKGKGFGKQVVGSASLAGLSNRTVTPIMGDHLTPYIDAGGGTIGSTAIASTFFSWELNISTGRKPRHYLGALPPGNWNDPAWTATFKTSLEVNATSKAYVDALIAPGVVKHLLRMKHTTDSSHIAQIDFSGNLKDSPSLFSDNAGLSTYDLEYDFIHDNTFGNWLKTSITNTLSALP